ncbi:MAG: cation transporter [Oscillospiraceae bacterium]|nr:cation transporter [Oscillospiraceae bacterium]
MIEMTAAIDGMACGMCEAHVNDAIRAHFPVKQVKSSHKKGQAVIVAEAAIAEDDLRQVLGEIGYKLISLETKTQEKKRFSLFGK